MTIRGLIFDYGGVLWDMRWDVARSLAEQHGLAERAIVETLYGDGMWRQIEIGTGDRDAWLRGAHAALETQAGRPIPPLHDHWREHQHWITPNIELIRRLRPPYRTAVLSNADSTLTARFKEIDGMWELFDDFVCSADVGMAKPDERIYRLAAERLGLAPEECIFIDDLERNTDAARAVGMHVVHYRVDLGHSLEALLAEAGVTAT